ncbi:sodium:solute symporter [Bhargavaea beijingensis]|uniref:Sodium:solute symporter n=1 Tax=Bhargavaea beijingensis TaxID=426756 RepID=A0A1G7A080_9BACL|nr:sodium:solute symporter [Bhargavaea beijingensis]MCW1927245.1 sodium:solute symporter [Bhargavaea beijingensis]RSK35621.1 sodium:solute symporter [Bhargavaea beijingensis]SDE08348.1 solute:Na+ symporter, SSS family [Bhargavaea beijingensis]
MGGTFAVIDYVILFAYLLFILYVGIAVAKKEMQGKEFFKGDGSIPWWVTSVSLFATLLSPISFLSLAGNSYLGSWELWFAQLGLFIAVPVAIYFFLPVYRKLNLDTAYEYLERRFDVKMRMIGSVLFIVYQIGRMSIIMYLPAIALSAVTGINTVLIILFMGVIATIYSAFGGIKSVLWTDFIQGVVLIGGGVFALIFLLFSIDGGIGEVFRTGTDNGKFFTDMPLFDLNFVNNSILLLIFGAGLSTAFSYISSQDMVQRYLTTNDTKEMNKMTYLNGLLSLGTATLFFFIGTALYTFYTQQGGAMPDGKGDLIFANYIVSELPVGISGLLIAGLFAAGQSTLSTGLNSVATSWTLDIQNVFKPGMSDEKSTKIARVVSALVGVFSIGFAILLAYSDVSSAYEWFNGLMGLALGIIGGTFTLGVMTKKANAKGALLGFIATTALAIYISYFTDITLWAYSIINLMASLIFGYGFSLLFKEKSKAEDGDMTFYDQASN